MINVMVVDDSIFFQNLIKRLLHATPDIRVLKTARNGKECIKSLSSDIDVIILDINMPVMDGFETLQYIVDHNPIPTIIFSGEIEYDARLTAKALSIGAMSVILKPKFSEIEKIGTELIEKIRAAAKIDRKNFKKLMELSAQGNKQKAEEAEEFKKIIVVGASTGGPQALSILLSAIPPNFNAPILIAQHIHPQFTKSLAETLDNACSVTVKESEQGEAIKPLVYIAKGDHHMTVSDGTIVLDKKAKINSVRPAVDPLFMSAAKEFGEKVIGVLLTGMGSDGCAGMKEIKAHGGRTIAQDSKTSIVFSMPKCAIDSGAADKVLPISEIADELVKIVGYLKR